MKKNKNKSKAAKVTAITKAKATPRLAAKPAARISDGMTNTKSLSKTNKHDQASATRGRERESKQMTAHKHDQAREPDQAELDQARREADQYGDVATTAATNTARTMDLENASPDELRDLVRELTLECARLMEVEEMYDQLRADLEDASEEDDDGRAKPTYTRGKLPGGELIRTNNQTGAYETITREQWDKLPWK